MNGGDSLPSIDAAAMLACLGGFLRDPRTRLHLALWCAPAGARRPSAAALWPSLEGALCLALLRSVSTRGQLSSLCRVTAAIASIG